MFAHIAQRRISRHERDVDLFGRLFAQWAQARARLSNEADRRLDAIEAQLVGLERTVTMTSGTARPSRPPSDRPDTRRATVPLAAQRT